MVIREADRAIARRMYEVAVGMVAAREQASVAELAHDALNTPTPSSIRALLAVGHGRPWLPSVIDALAQVGIAAIEDVMAPDHVAIDGSEWWMLRAPNETDEEFEKRSLVFRGRADVLAWREVLGWMRSGITLDELRRKDIAEDLGEVVSGWVDEQRGVK
jgi:hypothetical protein